MEKGSRAWGVKGVPLRTSDVKFIKMTRPVLAAFPPLFFSSLPKRAIGFSYPSGNEGRVLGLALAATTASIGLLLYPTLGFPAFLLMLWLTGGTAGLMLYNSTRGRVAFLKHYCSACRLRPLIEEHETMHLAGEPSEEVVWAEALKKHSYESLSLAGDPRICSFCPIAKRLRAH